MRSYALPNDGPVNEADLSTNHEATIATLTADLAAERAEIERLRDAGDAMADDVPHGYESLRNWEEARRG